MTPPEAEKLDDLLQGVWNTAQWAEKNRSGEEYFAWKDTHLAEAKRRLQSLLDAARADILRTAIDNIHDEIDAGVPEDLASRTVLLQMEYDATQQRRDGEGS
jgi:hypothetical protein